MPIETAIWRIDGGLKPVPMSALDENKLTIEKVTQHFGLTE